MEMEKKKAISLIVLVVTIIVMAILAATVIIALSNQNIISEANKSVIKSELSSLQEKIAMYVVDNYTSIDASVKYNLDEFGIDKSDNMYKKYGSISYVYDGKLYITSSASETVQEIARELNMLSGELNSTEGEIKLKNASLTNLILYGNSVQDGTPTPDNPVEIQSVGEKTKNLFDFNWIDNKVYKGITYTKTRYGIVVNGTTESSTSYTSMVSVLDKLQVGKTYRISGSADGVLVVFRQKSAEGEFIYRDVYTVTGTESELEVYLQVNSDTTVNNVLIKPQLEEGNTATEYEPYGYKIPVTVSGKNLFDGNMQQGAYLVAEGNYVGVTNYICNKNPIYVDDTKNYYISRKDASEGYLQYILCYGENDTYLGYVSVSNKGSTFKPLENTKYINFDILKASDKANITAQEAGLIQIEEGTAATEYEPYQGSTTTNIYLDEPLRKIGDYADYIDFASGKVVRKIKSKTIKSVPFKVYPEISGYYRFEADTSDKLHTNSLSSNVISNVFETIKYNEYKDNSISERDNYNYLRILSSKYSTIGELNAAIGDNTIYYVLATPLEQTIHLPSINATKGTCVITVDTSVKPSNMQVKYN